MIQIIDNIDHRSKKPNFVRDQFDTLQAMKQFPESDIDEGHISYCRQTDKHYKFKSENSLDTTTGRWREFKGEKGDPGEPGKNGQSVSSNFTAFVFRSSQIEPGKPTGGSWDPINNIFTPPKGWSVTDSELLGIIWMSWAVFTAEGNIRDAWAPPIRLTGEDGKNGTDGKSIEFIYKLANREPNSTDKPSSINEDDYVPSGWSDNPTGISISQQYEWVCIRVKTNTTWSDWNGPTIWSKWGSDGRDGDGVEYIYRRTTTNTSPERPTDISQEDEFLPSGWTDNPTGVSSSYMYEWVCVRKFKEGSWGAFSEPALWAKWGEKGDPGRDGSDGTSVNIKGSFETEDQLPISAQPGDAYIVGSDLYVWDGIRWNNIGGIKGPTGDSAYVHLAFADGIETDNDGVVTKVYGFTTSGSVNKAYMGTCADHNVADPTDPLVYKWVRTKGDKGDEGPQGVPGDKGENGITLYTWIRYADDSNGSGISNSPNGKQYIGLAYNKITPSESSDPRDYTWSKITGTDGVPGPAGEDGKTLYTWIKYADIIPTSSQDIIYDIPNDGTKYIGIAVNKETATESSDGTLYTWSLFRGKDGTDGSNGRIIYPAGIYEATITYTATNEKAPYVLHGDNYYVMNKTASWLGTSTGKTPQENYDEFGSLATWIPMETFSAVFTDILIATNGTIGSFVFNGDYMFSKWGIDSQGQSTNQYQNFNPSNIKKGSFSPNFCVNGDSGAVIMRNADITGGVDARLTYLDSSTDADYIYFNKSGVYTAGYVNPFHRPIISELSKDQIAISLMRRWIVDASSPEDHWTDITIVNTSNFPLFIGNSIVGTAGHQAFQVGIVNSDGTYETAYVHAVVIRPKFIPVTFKQYRVPEDTYVYYGNPSDNNKNPLDHLVFVSEVGPRLGTVKTFTINGTPNCTVYII